MLRPFLGALGAFLVSLTLASPASAVPDVPLDAYLEHLEPLTLAWPADGTVTDGYGTRWGRMHWGIDIGILERLDVRAAASGTVTASGWLTGYEGYGNVVTVDSGSGYSTLYAHLSIVRRSCPASGSTRAIRSARQVARALAPERTCTSSSGSTTRRSTRRLTFVSSPITSDGGVRDPDYPARSP